MWYEDIIDEFSILRDPIKAQTSSRFFKTWPGQYGEGDRFLWITVPDIRKIVKKFAISITLPDIEQLLCSPFHEIRVSGVLFLVHVFERAEKEEQEWIFRFYLNHTKQINNWDLVDISAPRIMGAYLWDKNRDALQELSRSGNLWERRISIIATLYFIKKGDCDTTFSIAETLLSDKHDLIHKANGWMLREIGKWCGEKVLESFLMKYYHFIPRTTLRYAIEKLEPKRKKYWMEYTWK